jgi:predicted phage replisome organizer/uncharacterized phage protein (TIGR02220 family)
MNGKVEWVKITTDMFDNRKIKYLRKLPEGNSIVLIWVMLLTMAGRCSANGMIFLTENVPYTTKSLADELGFDENIIKFALAAFESLNMVRTNPEDFLQISGWEEYQDGEALDKIREVNRNRKRRQRENQKLLEEMSRDCHGTVTGHVTVDVTGQSRDNCVTEKERTKEKDYIYIYSNNEKDLSQNPSQVSNDIDTQVAIPGNSLVRDNQVTLTPTPSEKPSVNYMDADTVIDYMNSVSGKKYRHIKSNRDRVLARLGEGYSVEDCKTVVKKMWDAWKNTEMEQYFRPETLFRPTKFEGYLNRPVEKGKPRIDPSEYETGKDFGW